MFTCERFEDVNERVFYNRPSHAEKRGNTAGWLSHPTAKTSDNTSIIRRIYSYIGLQSAGVWSLFLIAYSIDAQFASFRKVFFESDQRKNIYASKWFRCLLREKTVEVVSKVHEHRLRQRIRSGQKRHWVGSVTQLWICRDPCWIKIPYYMV